MILFGFRLGRLDIAMVVNPRPMSWGLDREHKAWTIWMGPVRLEVAYGVPH